MSRDWVTVPVEPTNEMLAARLEAHARIHDEHVPHDAEQARWAADLREAAAVVRGAAQPAQALDSRHVYVRLTRPAGYEDVHPQLIVEDAGIKVEFLPEVVEPAQAQG